jgi:flavodoxin
MNIKVMYHSQTGNTAKVARAIAEEMGVQAEEITEGADIGMADLLFIGDGIYMGKPAEVTQHFIDKLAGCNVRYAAIFGTYGGQKKAIPMMKEALEKKGIIIFDEAFGCRGKSWAILNRKHPDENDLAGAKQFAKWALNSMNKQSI